MHVYILCAILLIKMQYISMLDMVTLYQLLELGCTDWNDLFRDTSDTHYTPPHILNCDCLTQLQHKLKTWKFWNGYYEALYLGRNTATYLMSLASSYYRPTKEFMYKNICHLKKLYFGPTNAIQVQVGTQRFFWQWIMTLIEFVWCWIHWYFDKFHILCPEV